MSEPCVISTVNGNGDILVDSEMYESLSKFRWYLDDNGYANRVDTSTGKRKKVYMHRQINQTPDGMLTDHLNGNRRDNRKANLRNASFGQNNLNKTKRKNAIHSRFMGVSKVTSSKRNKCWRMRLRTPDKDLCLYFYTELEAAMSYNEYAIREFGQHAKLNDVSGASTN
jgi:hypothetical protein